MFIARTRLNGSPTDKSVGSPMPTVDELVQIAIGQSDFLGDLDFDTLRDEAFNAADLAAEIWEVEHGYPDNTAVGPIPLELLLKVRAALIDTGTEILNRRQEDARDYERALERDNSDWFPQPPRSV